MKTRTFSGFASARMFRASLFVVAFSVLFFPAAVRAQDNYEIQVYASETQAPKTLMVELHSNYTAQGTTTIQYGMLPTQGQEHETVELTAGINDWSEVGFYIFTSAQSGHSWQWVGDHIRPRVRIPDKWHWPVGLSLSSEFGYARPQWANPTWSLQIMPIIDQTHGRWYWSVNTTMFLDLHIVPAPAGSTPAELANYYKNVAPRGLTFGPAATLTFQPSKYFNFGLEYYGYYGQFGQFVTWPNQGQDFFPVVNLFVSPKWEINFGVGIGATPSTDHVIIKCIIGRHFDFSHRKAGGSESTQ